MATTADTDARYWIIAPDERDAWVDPLATRLWRIVDEDAGGTVAYASTLTIANEIVNALNKADA